MQKNKKVWCYFCDRVFDNEVHLINHQKMVHFRCQICRRQKLNSKALSDHMSQVHKEILEKVPNALPDRDSPDNTVFGMRGIPESEYVKWLTSINPEFREKTKGINFQGAVLANDMTRMASLAHKTAAQNITFNQLNQFNSAVNVNPGQSTLITARGIVNSESALQQQQKIQQRIQAGSDDVAQVQRRYDVAMQKAKEIVDDLMYQAEKERKQRTKLRSKSETLYYEVPPNGLSVFEMRANFIKEQRNPQNVTETIIVAEIE